MASRLFPKQLSSGCAPPGRPKLPGSLPGWCDTPVGPSLRHIWTWLHNSSSQLLHQPGPSRAAASQPLPLHQLPTQTQCPGRNKLGPHQLVTLALQWPCLSDDRGNPSSKLTTNMKQAAAFTGEPGQCRAPHQEMGSILRHIPAIQSLETLN